jgi:hypothetical protein
MSSQLTQEPQISQQELFQVQRPERLKPADKEYFLNVAEQLREKPYETRSLFAGHPLHFAEKVKEGSNLTIDAESIAVAIVLAEPQGEYDENQRRTVAQGEGSYKTRLETRKTALNKEIETAAEALLRLTLFVEQNFSSKEQIQRLLKEGPIVIYASLLQVAFGTVNQKEIEKNYSQETRRKIKLGVLNFITDFRKLAPYLEEFSNTPQEAAEKYFAKRLDNQPLKSKPQVRILPVGIICSLSAEDYEQVFGENQSHGKTLFGGSLPPELKGKLVVVKVPDFDSTGKVLQDTFIHEARHIFFSSFLRSGETLFAFDTEEKLKKSSTLEDHQHHARSIRDFLTERAKDEVLAYATHDEFIKDKESLGSTWQRHIEEVINFVWQQPISWKEKKQIIMNYYQEYRSCMMEIRRFQWMTQKLFQSGANKERSAALLYVTNLRKVHRLAPKVGISEENVDETMNGEIQEQVRVFSQEVDTILNVSETKNLSELKDYALLELIERYRHFEGYYPPDCMESLFKILHNTHDLIVASWVLRIIEVVLDIDTVGLDHQRCQEISQMLHKFTLSNSENPKFGGAVDQATKLVLHVEAIKNILILADSEEENTKSKTVTESERPRNEALKEDLLALFRLAEKFSSKTYGSQDIEEVWMIAEFTFRQLVQENRTLSYQEISVETKSLEKFLPLIEMISTHFKIAQLLRDDPGTAMSMHSEGKIVGINQAMAAAQQLEMADDGSMNRALQIALLEVIPPEDKERVYLISSMWSKVVQLTSRGKFGKATPVHNRQTENT